jgi:hypothetical protein
LKFKFAIVEQHEFIDNGRKCFTYGRILSKKGAIVQPVPSTNNKDPLTYKICSAVAGKKLTKEQGERVSIADLNRLIGKQLRVGVSISAPKPDGKQFNNVDSFYAAKQVLPPFDEKNIVFDQEPVNTPVAPATPVALPQTGAAAPVPATYPQPVAAATVQESAPASNELEVDDINVDDIPF